MSMRTALRMILVLASALLCYAVLFGSASATPANARYLGGLNHLDAYCQSYGYDHASVLSGRWYCTDGGYYSNTHGRDTPGYVNDPLDLNNACRWQYPAYPQAYFVQGEPGNPFSGGCYAQQGLINLGGLDHLDAYCQSYGYDHASVLNGMWYCSLGGYYTNTHGNDQPGYVNDLLNFDWACQWQYPAYSNPFFQRNDPGNPFSGSCYAYA